MLARLEAARALAEADAPVAGLGAGAGGMAGPGVKPSDAGDGSAGIPAANPLVEALPVLGALDAALAERRAWLCAAALLLALLAADGSVSAAGGPAPTGADGAALPAAAAPLLAPLRLALAAAGLSRVAPRPPALGLALLAAVAAALVLLGVLATAGLKRLTSGATAAALRAKQAATWRRGARASAGGHALIPSAVARRLTAAGGALASQRAGGAGALLALAAQAAVATGLALVQPGIALLAAVTAVFWAWSPVPASPGDGASPLALRPPPASSTAPNGAQEDDAAVATATGALVRSRSLGARSPSRRNTLADSSGGAAAAADAPGPAAPAATRSGAAGGALAAAARRPPLPRSPSRQALLPDAGGAGATAPAVVPAAAPAALPPSAGGAAGAGSDAPSRAPSLGLSRAQSLAAAAAPLLGGGADDSTLLAAAAASEAARARQLVHQGWLLLYGACLALALPALIAWARLPAGEW